MDKIKLTTEIEHKGDFDVIVAGGGLAGVAAAVSAARKGRASCLSKRLFVSADLRQSDWLISLFRCATAEELR